MSTSWFDPRDLRCKSPFGAVPCGAAVTFCFRPERGAAITRCELLAHGEFADRWTTLELAPVFEDGGMVYRGVFTAPNDIELVWYHFRLSWADGGTSCCGKAGLCAWDAVEPWQLTVYDDTHKTPEWFGRGLTYQIFPDRFCRAKKRDVAGLVGARTLHERWDELPEYRPNAQGEITCSDFFGGDLQGITEKLDYLASLGVTTLYLCPIFEASTNHRYDTACYERIDPLLGDEEDFRTLCAEAKKRGIHVMLDGVFNHT
ncbi:MAG: alpha-amylase family glycosyl hydrolase, partial [Oscillibacter sp.]|nr:alpha-amylase family glycosyl hydrolase [Oscillibacter sp.]